MSARQTSVRLNATHAVWPDWIISGLLIVFMLSDAIPKILKLDFAVEGTKNLGFPESAVVGVGVALLVSTVLYTIPRTAVIGAILLTGFLGGAIATQARLEDPWLVFPAILAVLTWVGLVMRQPRIGRIIWQ